MEHYIDSKNILADLIKDGARASIEHRNQKIPCAPYHYPNPNGPLGYIIMIRKGVKYFPYEMYKKMMQQKVLIKPNFKKKDPRWDYKLWVSMWNFRKLKTLGYDFKVYKKEYNPNF